RVADRWEALATVEAVHLDLDTQRLAHPVGGRLEGDQPAPAGNSELDGGDAVGANHPGEVSTVEEAPGEVRPATSAALSGDALVESVQGRVEGMFILLLRLGQPSAKVAHRRSCNSLQHGCSSIRIVVCRR